MPSSTVDGGGDKSHSNSLVIANENAEVVETAVEETENGGDTDAYTNISDAAVDEAKKTEEKKKLIDSSYKAKENIKSVLFLSEKPFIKDVNDQYVRTRRYDNAGKYRIGPTFITKEKLSYIDAHKPGRLSVSPDESLGNNLEFGLLTYLWTFTDQHDKQVIDLAFLKSLIESGVNINSRDEHGQTILHAIVRDWHPEVALFAIRNNSDVNAQDHYGRSPLHLAAALNCVELVKLLLMNGSDVNQESYKELQTPVHYAGKYNALDALKLLIKYSGSITKRDYRNRTVLFLAAESGSSETAQFLLDVGAPVGVYDNNGNSALTMLLEKIPNVAYRALEQYRIRHGSLRQYHVYLSHLETDTTSKASNDVRFARTPLEIVTAYDDVDMIMHPVIQKSLEVKWNLFGKMDTIKRLLITLVYLACWLVLSYTYSDNGEYYYTKTVPKDWSVHTWKIVFEALIIIFALYFFLKEFLIKKERIGRHQRFLEWKQHQARAQYIFCHPAWPGEREQLEAEVERIRTIPTLAGKQKFWFVYEFVILLLLATSIVLRILAMIFDTNMKLYITAKVIFTINMVFSFVRMLKICIRFRYFSVFLKVSGLAISSFIQIGFLYVQIYVAFVAAFWLMFGGQAGTELLMQAANNADFKFEGRQVSNYTAKELQDHITSLENIFYFVFEVSFGQNTIYLFEKVDLVNMQILISLFHIFSTFITLSIFVAFITSKFTTNFKRCVSEASLLQASIVLEVEEGLSRTEQMKVRKYYETYCCPLVASLEPDNDDIRERDALSKLAQSGRHIASVEKSIKDVEEQHRRNDRKSHTAIFEGILERTSVLASKQDAFGTTINNELKDVVQKQTYMNKYLTKLL